MNARHTGTRRHIDALIRVCDGSDCPADLKLADEAADLIERRSLAARAAQAIRYGRIHDLDRRPR